MATDAGVEGGKLNPGLSDAGDLSGVVPSHGGSAVPGSTALPASPRPGVFSSLVFAWVSPLIGQGVREELRMESLWPVALSDSANQLQASFESEVARDRRHGSQLAGDASHAHTRSTAKPPAVSDDTDGAAETASRSVVLGKPLTLRQVLWPMWRMCRVGMAKAGVGMAVYSCCSLLIPVLLRGLVSAIDDADTSSVWFAVALFGTQAVGAVANHQQLFHSYRAGQRLRALVISLVYRKCLRLSVADQSDVDPGEVTNLISTDAQKLYDTLPHAHLTWAAPLQVVVATSFLLLVLGPSALAGVVTLACLIPLNATVARAMGRLRRAHMQHSDERVKLCSEVMDGMRVVKLFSWEGPYEHRIRNIRAQEMSYAKREALLFALSMAMLVSLPVVAVVVAFVVHTVASDESDALTAADAFASLAMFSVLRFPLMTMSNLLSSLVQALTGLRRLCAFLSVAEHPVTAAADRLPNDLGAADGTDGLGVTVNDAAYGWVAPPRHCTGATDGARCVRDCSHDAADASGDAAGASSFQVHGVSFHASPGQLVVVLGSVASGKSTLVNGLLGEACQLRGTTRLSGSVALATQQAWIQNATVRDNIVFGRPWDADRYNSVVHACALEDDLRQFPAGDRTEIGEKGVTLSGGQKQRVALARAAYGNSDVVLLDDPLSALDASTAAHVFEHLIGPSGLLRRATRVLVTHAAHVLPQADRIIVLHMGRVEFNGTFAQLSGPVPAATATRSPVPPSAASAEESKASRAADAGDALRVMDTPTSLLATLRVVARKLRIGASTHSHASGDEEKQGPAALDAATDTPTKQLDIILGLGRARSSSSAGFLPGSLDGLARSRSHSGQSHGRSKKGTIMSEEGVAVGAVSTKVYKNYISAGGGVGVCLLLLVAFITERVAFVGTDWWLSEWMSATGPSASPAFGLPTMSGNASAPTAASQARGFSSDHEVRLYYASGYAVFCAVNVAAVTFRTTVFAWFGVTAAEQLFLKMLHAVLRSPLAWFDVTPIGRIISRFSFDTETIDFILITRVMNSVASVFWLICGLSILTAVTPLVTAALAPVMIVYYIVQHRFRYSSRALQRLDNVSRSPIQSHVTESLAGTSTIRAFNSTVAFIQVAAERIDENTRAVFAYHSATRWLGVRVELLGAVVTLAAGLACFLARETLSGGASGLVIIWAFNLTVTLNLNVTFFSEAEARLSSVERVLEFTELPSEPPVNTASEFAPPTDWPAAGAVEFKDVVLRYRPDLEPALSGLTVSIRAAERVAVVGRSGAGKSTIAAAALRCYELSGGTVTVDGIDLARLGLGDVRGRAMAIIPQDPLLFTGTVRSNLDPFDEYKDEQVWDAVRMVRMGTAVAGLGGLSSRVQENGGNFSVGERQLLCLARALLRQPRVLVLDEATASVDLETDEFIQETIREAFSSTLITIAHRLETVTDYDKVLVMEGGRCVEFGSPSELLTKEPAGEFAKLIDAAGPAAATRLRRQINQASDRDATPEVG